MTFSEDLDQVCELVEDIASSTELPQSSVDLPDISQLLSQLSEAGLTSPALDAGDTHSQEVVAATIGTEVGLAKSGIVFPIADFDLFPRQLTNGTELKTALPEGTLLVPWSAIDGEKPVPWSEYAKAFLTYRLTHSGCEIALFDDFELTDTTTGIDGSPSSSIRPSAPLSWIPSSMYEHDRVNQIRQTTTLAVIAALLAEVVKIEVKYTTERTQFGRPIGRFQAVQRLVSESAAHAETVASSAASTLRLLIAEPDTTVATKIEVISGCLVSFDAIETVVRNSHQAVGAIGTTLEHSLQRYTRALLKVRRQMTGYTELVDSLSDLLSSTNESAWKVISA